MPVTVADDLKFDMMGIPNQLLDVNVAVSECLFRLHARGVK